MTSETLTRELREAGLRATAARLAVLRLLRDSASPQSHGEIAQTLQAAPWSRATLYRNLIDLEKAGLVRRTQLGEPVWRFEDAAKKHGVRSHPHFLCSSCGKMVCLPHINLDLDQVTGINRALAHGGYEIQLRGHCDDCHRPGDV